MDLFQKYKDNWTPFDTYEVEILLRDVVGGIPQNPDLIESWLKGQNKKMSKEERDKIKEAHELMLADAIDEKMEKTGIGFHKKDGQLCLEGRQVKAMLKEAANIIKDIAPIGKKDKGKDIFGIHQLKARAAEMLFVPEEFIPLGRAEPDAIGQRKDGGEDTTAPGVHPSGRNKPDKVLQKPIHVDTAQGPRDSIKVFEICFNVPLSFTVHRFRGPGKMSGGKLSNAVPEPTLKAILEYCQWTGLGADRSQGRGQFKVTRCEKVEVATK